MRKKHQAVLINSSAKKNFCNEISLGNFTYETEQKEQLRDYFNNNLNEEDLENQDEENSSDEDSFEVSNIKVPKQPIGNPKEYAKLQIGEKAIVSGIDPANYETIPQKIINICDDSSGYTEDNNKDLGATIKFFDVIKNCIFWKEKNDSKGIRNSEIDCFQLFNLNPDKLKEITQKLIELKRLAHEKQLDGNSVFNKFMAEMENKYVEQKKELHNLISNLEYIDTVSYGDKWSVVGFQKVKIVG